MAVEVGRFPLFLTAALVALSILSDSWVLDGVDHLAPAPSGHAGLGTPGPEILEPSASPRRRAHSDPCRAATEPPRRRGSLAPRLGLLPGRPWSLPEAPRPADPAHWEGRRHSRSPA